MLEFVGYRLKNILVFRKLWPPVGTVDARPSGQLVVIYSPLCAARPAVDVVPVSVWFQVKMAKLVLAILLLSCCACAVRSINDRLREVYSWRQVDFTFPNQQTRDAAIASGEYVQANNLPLGLDVWRDKLFITVPRWKTGVASSLNYVCLGLGKYDYTRFVPKAGL